MSESIQLSGNAALSDVNPADPKLFSQEKILPYFEQMRAEQPVHFCKESAYGPFLVSDALQRHHGGRQKPSTVFL